MKIRNKKNKKEISYIPSAINKYGILFSYWKYTFLLSTLLENEF